MRLVWVDRAWDDYLFWQTNDPAVLRRVNELIKDAGRNPFTGLGKPEPLKGNLKGLWSRRITGANRLVYRVSAKDADQALEILQCHWHYN